MKKYTGPLASFISFALVICLYAPAALASDKEDTYKNLEVFANILSILEKNYVEEVDTEEVLRGAIKGMLATLDPHSSYMKPESFRNLQIETSGSFSGIGIEITMKEGVLIVVAPIEGTPAEQEGLKAADKIIKIEDEYTKDLSMMEAVKLLRGPKGSKVRITIHREGWTEVKEVTIIRDVIPLQSVKHRLIEPQYGVVRITNFQSQTTKDALKAIRDLQSEDDLKGLILDLRDNPGGLLDQAVSVADIFLDEGVIVSTKGRLPDQEMEFKARAGGPSHDFPVVVLVNGGSASASEIVAGALQDHKRALILGEQSFGKGSVQTVIPMNNGAGLRLTTARYYTPKGISIQAKGITPDLVVHNQENPAELASDLEPEGKNHVLREKDLKHHITNGNDKDTQDEVDEDREVKAKQDKELQHDNQLRSALMVLKGVSVFGSNIKN